MELSILRRTFSILNIEATPRSRSADVRRSGDMICWERLSRMNTFQPGKDKICISLCFWIWRIMGRCFLGFNFLKINLTYCDSFVQRRVQFKLWSQDLDVLISRIYKLFTGMDGLSSLYLILRNNLKFICFVTLFIYRTLEIFLFYFIFEFGCTTVHSESKKTFLN